MKSCTFENNLEEGEQTSHDKNKTSFREELVQTRHCCARYNFQFEYEEPLVNCTNLSIMMFDNDNYEKKTITIIKYHNFLLTLIKTLIKK